MVAPKVEAHRKNVGKFIQARRAKLGLSQGGLVKALGFSTPAQVSNVECGREGIPAKRVYAWADALGLTRDNLYNFVTGKDKEFIVSNKKSGKETMLNSEEFEIVSAYRKLTPKLKINLIEHAKMLVKMAEK